MVQCLCIDEADSLGIHQFNEELFKIMQHIPQTHQTILLSTVIIEEIPHFILKTLVNSPVVLQSSLVDQSNIQQDLVLVKEESKLKSLLEVMQKTEPPVLIFTFLKDDVDIITEYLLIKGVNAVSLHADKDQVERTKALKDFLAGSVDVLVATDIASKVFLNLITNFIEGATRSPKSRVGFFARLENLDELEKLKSIELNQQ